MSKSATTFLTEEGDISPARNRLAEAVRILYLAEAEVNALVDYFADLAVPCGGSKYDGEVGNGYVLLSQAAESVVKARFAVKRAKVAEREGLAHGFVDMAGVANFAASDAERLLFAVRAAFGLKEPLVGVVNAA